VTNDVLEPSVSHQHSGSCYNLTGDPSRARNYFQSKRMHNGQKKALKNEMLCGHEARQLQLVCCLAGCTANHRFCLLLVMCLEVAACDV